MSWLRKGQSLIRNSVSSSKLSDGDRSSLSSNGAPPVIDSRAALDSFKMHWRQAWDIMQRKVSPPGTPIKGPGCIDTIITSDDVTSIVNHIDQMIALLIQESQGLTRSQSMLDGNTINSTPSMLSPLLGKFT